MTHRARAVRCARDGGGQYGRLRRVIRPALVALALVACAGATGCTRTASPHAYPRTTNIVEPGYVLINDASRDRGNLLKYDAVP
jgi:hypothetical protein